MRELKRVVLATDLSPNAEQAAARVALLPLADRAEVHLLHVVPPLPSRAQRLAITGAHDSLCETKAKLHARTEVKFAPEVVVGEPFPEIVRAARRHGAQLVVMGRHSKRGRQWGLGSTTERVVRSGSTPVLVVQRAAPRPYCRPVVALDLSDVSRTVIDVAQLVLGGETQLRLLHAYRAPFEGVMATSTPRAEMRTLDEQYRRKANAAIDELEAAIGPQARGWHRTVRHGEPRTMLLREVVARKADIVVLGTHGRSGVSHFLLGSVAEWVLQNAPCDVLICRPERFTFELP